VKVAEKSLSNQINCLKLININNQDYLGAGL